MHLDLRFDAFARASIGEYDDGPRGVPQRELRDAQRRAFCVGLALGVHDEIQDRGPCDGASQLARVRALRPAQPHELALERGDAVRACTPEGGVDDDHAFRHSRPSRSISASASAGPHVPASYSGGPDGEDCQASMIGSTNSHC